MIQENSKNTCNVETKSPSLVPVITSKGRVENFRENAISRKIPIALQRDVYRQTTNHSTVELIKGFISLRDRTELMTDESVQAQYSAKVISVRDTKTIKETAARKAIKTFSTARREWMNSKERKELLKESLSIEMKFTDVLFLHNCWLEYYNSLMKEEIELRDVIPYLPRDGCLIKVISSTMPQDVGLEGIVLYEGENSFIIITKEDRIKRINKRGHVFSILGISQSITLYGDYMEMKSVFQQEKQWNRLFSSQKHI